MAKRGVNRAPLPRSHPLWDAYQAKRQEVRNTRTMAQFYAIEPELRAAELAIIDTLNDATDSEG